MDLIKGLESGLFCLAVTGNAAYRKKYRTSMKAHLDNGIIVNEIRPAPRDARYKIDWYFRNGISTNDTIDYEYLNFHEDTFKFLGIDESFNPTDQLKNIGSFICENDFELCYGQVDRAPLWKDDTVCKSDGYYFKYKGEANTLDFLSSPEVADYSNKFWSSHKDYITIYRDFSTLMHNVGYFMQYHKIL